MVLTYILCPSIFNNAYRLIGPPMDWAISKHFHSGKEGLIYEKLYKKNMDGKKSFVSTEIGLERLLESDSQALISNLPIQNFEDFQCKVSIPYLGHYNRF